MPTIKKDKNGKRELFYYNKAFYLIQEIINCLGDVDYPSLPDILYDKRHELEKTFISASNEEKVLIFNNVSSAMISFM